MQRLVRAAILVALVSVPFAGTAQAHECQRWIHIHSAIGNVCLGPQN